MSNTTYPTKYQNISQNELHGLFSTERWGKLSFQDRVAACQEVENRFAAANHVEPCQVTPVPLVGREYGSQLGSRIEINQSLLEKGCFQVKDLDEKGDVVYREIPVDAPNWNILDTIYHEGTHGVQEQQGRMAQSYFGPDSDYDLYRIQACEKEAYANGQYQTLSAIQDVKNSTGMLDQGTSNYVQSIRADSFQQYKESAQMHYNDPNIETTVNTVIYNSDRGIAPENPTPSYAAVETVLDSQYTTMELDDGANLSMQSPSFSQYGGMESDGSELTASGYDAEAIQTMDDGADYGAGMSSDSGSSSSYDGGADSGDGYGVE